jgi:hypothetical protein
LEIKFPLLARMLVTQSVKKEGAIQRLDGTSISLRENPERL